MQPNGSESRERLTLYIQNRRDLSLWRQNTEGKGQVPQSNAMGQTDTNASPSGLPATYSRCDLVEFTLVTR